MQSKVSIFWFRRDLRLEDNAGLYYALKSENPVVPIFIFDTNILEELEDKHDKRLVFIHNALEEIQKELLKLGSTLHILYGMPSKCFNELVNEYEVAAVYTNRDYEPYAKDRDEQIAKQLKEVGATFNTFKDQVIFDQDEIVKGDGKFYSIYTPYSKRWREKLNDFYLKPYPNRKYFKNFFKQDARKIPSLETLGFKDTKIQIVKPKLVDHIAKTYDKTRDFPGDEDGTTRLSVHLRFGTISIRELAKEALKLNDVFLGELIWRDFYQMILYFNPQVVSHSFKLQYDHIKWRNNEQEFEAWCNGNTGYPIVDAGMRQLNEIGWMHNRVRMITASFLCKHLLIDWRWGEAYFGKKLIDYDLASNNGGWQWSAGTGCDAAPYFRIFNPYTQTEKFDKDGTYIRRWVPEVDEIGYPEPIVQHEAARERCLRVYKAGINATK